MTQWGLDTLFNPAKRHMDEEKRRLQSTREEIGDSSGGKRIDLESGKVTISRGQPKGGPDEADGGSDQAETADGGSDQAETADLLDGAAAEPTEGTIAGASTTKGADEPEPS
ncbi:MAG: hypothetical protein DLM57_07555 [Pseudonocardiales bacterium]|nr:MAG: hypothetical protein DLM57_07555 [Pseudonocardiales bacterium]